MSNHLKVLLVLSCILLLAGCSKEASIDLPSLNITVAQPNNTTQTETIPNTVPVEQTAVVEESSDAAAETLPDMYEQETTLAQEGLAGLDFSSMPKYEKPTKATKPVKETTAKPTEKETGKQIGSIVTTAPTTVAPTTQAPETKPTVGETKPNIGITIAANAGDGNKSVGEPTSIMSQGATVYYPTSGTVAYKKQVDVPDVTWYDKDAYGNYIIKIDTLKNSIMKLPRLAKYGNKIPYCYYYDANGLCLNPLPTDYRNYIDLFYLGE